MILTIERNKLDQFDKLCETDADSNFSKDSFEISLFDEAGVRLIIQSKLIGQFLLV
jgi:hypothetical protein